MPTCDVAVAGAGIVGTACAYELSLAGLRVCLVESESASSSSSNQDYGSLSVQDDVPGQLALTRYGLALWEKLVDFLPPECEYRRCGTLWFAGSDKQMQIAALRRDFFRRQNIGCELLDQAQLRTIEPNLNAEVAGGLLVPGDGCLRTAPAAEFLLQLASQKGVQRIQQRAIRFHNHEVTLFDGSVLHAGSLINTGDANARTLTPELPLVYSKGHVLLVKTAGVCAQHQLSSLVREPLNEGSIRLELHQNSGGLNYFATDDTELWIGTSSQPVSEPTATLPVEPKVVATLLRKAIELIPAIGMAKPVRSWIALRASSADGLPFIGRLPARPDVFVAAAHADFGPTAALAAARLIVNDLLCQTSEIDPKPYRADRF